MLKMCAYPALVLALVSSRMVHADIITQIGTQHFTDGQSGIGTGTFTTAVSGQPAPFDNFYGSDVSGPNFAQAWAFNYSIPAGDVITGATVTIGIYDSDTVGTGNQVASFLLDTTHNLTTAANASFEAATSPTGGYKVYSVALSAGDWSALLSGSATFSLSLQNGAGILGDTAFNGAGLDFSKLDIQVQAAPEPASLALLGAGLLCLLRRPMPSPRCYSRS